MIKILNLALAGKYFIFSLIFLISSIPLLEAPSISITSTSSPTAIFLHSSHSQQGVGVTPFSQFNALAKILAIEVFPTPREPQNK